MSNIRDYVRGDIARIKEWLDQAEKASTLIVELPAAIQALPGSVSFSERYNSETEERCDCLTLSLSGGDTTVKVLNTYGITGLVKEFSPYSGTYSYSGGSLPVGFYNLVSVSGDISGKFDCEVEEYTESITRYREVCTKVEDEETADMD